MCVSYLKIMNKAVSIWAIWLIVLGTFWCHSEITQTSFLCPRRYLYEIVCPYVVCSRVKEITMTSTIWPLDLKKFLLGIFMILHPQMDGHTSQKHNAFSHSCFHSRDIKETTSFWTENTKTPFCKTITFSDKHVGVVLFIFSISCSYSGFNIKL